METSYIYYFNNSIGWGQMLIGALQDNNLPIINGFKKSNVYSDINMLEFSILAGRFDLITYYFQKISNNKDYEYIKLNYDENTQRIIIIRKKIHGDILSERFIDKDKVKYPNFNNLISFILNMS